jgi:hypothetical protein
VTEETHGTAAEEAVGLVYGDRAKTYGHPADVYEKVAELWSGYLEQSVTAKDVALLMVLFKLGRFIERPNRDSLVDAHGYLLVWERIDRRSTGEE